MLTRLEQHVPQPGAVDLRGWEWYYERGQSRIRQTLTSSRGTISGLAWSPDGQWLATCVNGPINIWDAARGQMAFTLDAPWRGGIVAEPLAFSPDGRWLASGGVGGDVDVWDIATRRVAHRLRGHSDGVTALAWSADSQRLASASQDKTARIWRVADEQSELVLPTQLESVKQMAWVADGTQIAIGAQLWSTADGGEVSALPAYGLAWSPDGRRFTDGFSLYDTVSGKLIAALQDQDQYNPSGSVAWSADGRFIALTRAWSADPGLGCSYRQTCLYAPRPDCLPCGLQSQGQSTGRGRQSGNNHDLGRNSARRGYDLRRPRLGGVVRCLPS